MKPIRALLPACLVLAAAPAAHASVSHTVQPGETLWSIAAANNFTTRALAAANGLSEDSQVVLGSTIQIPSESEAASALASGQPWIGSAGSSSQGSSASGSTVTPGSAPSAGGYLVQPGETLSGIAAAHGISTDALASANGLDPNAFAIAGTTLKIPTESSVATSPSSSASTAGPPPLGGYKVRPGDTLSGLAASLGVPAAQIAYMNGLRPDALLIIGTVLKLPTGSQAPPSAAEPAPAQTVVPQAAPNPTPEHVTSSEIAQVAAQHGVPASLASAIAWQESGFNNDMVSGANARGVMQILPGTWDWVNHNLASGSPLNPNSALDNVRGGVLYLRQLLNDFGGDANSAIAAYYQGEGAVRSRGMLPETQAYVNSVNALRSRFGG